MKALNDELQMRSDWLFPICSGAERLKRRWRAQDASDAKTRGVAPPHHPGFEPSRATWCSTRSSARAPRAVVAKRLGRRFIGIERDEAYAKAAVARIEAAEPLDRRLAQTRQEQARRAAHPVRRAGRARADPARHGALRSCRAA